ncbi:unnamed protein product [marine sediment metagenome]|uniref:Uncharacterized protein n=1 Tax=marine sediment metagenome TaxID=412755 RepID=X1EWP0_9ZZZZ
MEKIIAGVVTALIALIGAMIWYLKHQTRQQAKREDKHDAIQKEERDFSRGLVKNELKMLHKDSLLNAKLNRKSISMQKKLINQFTGLAEYLNRNFNGCADKVNFKKKVKTNGRKK